MNRFNKLLMILGTLVICGSEEYQEKWKRDCNEHEVFRRILK
ncbi:MAG: hypothetical protein ACRC92_25865 [Peptostreptococcaceae bacterium]